ncbi:helix-turn-helix domain-containing protein [Microbacterium sp. NPDC086615]|uniref:helix-turn-helix transcriptional regulator n=1 Tax=Microbacterium sp. NPDC086615 TaxID=3154865 RepID=UPI0034436271
MSVPEPDLTQLRVIFNRYREQSGMTFEQLAEHSGISRQTLLNISSGKYNGDLRTWLKLSRSFGEEVDRLLDDVWPQEPSAN